MSGLFTWRASIYRLTDCLQLMGAFSFIGGNLHYRGVPLYCYLMDGACREELRTFTSFSLPTLENTRTAVERLFKFFTFKVIFIYINLAYT